LNPGSNVIRGVVRIVVGACWQRLRDGSPVKVNRRATVWAFVEQERRAATMLTALPATTVEGDTPTDT